MPISGDVESLASEVVEEHVSENEDADGVNDSEWERSSQDPGQLVSLPFLRHVASEASVSPTPRDSEISNHIVQLDRSPHQRVQRAVSYAEETRLRVQRIRLEGEREKRVKEESRRRALVQKRKLDEIRRQQRQAMLAKK